MAYPASNEAGGGFPSEPDVQAALNCLTQLQQCRSYVPRVHSLALRGLMSWSINWDRFDGYQFSTPNGAFLNALPEP